MSCAHTDNRSWQLTSQSARWIGCGARKFEKCVLRGTLIADRRHSTPGRNPQVPSRSAPTPRCRRGRCAQPTIRAAQVPELRPTGRRMCAPRRRPARPRTPGQSSTRPAPSTAWSPAWRPPTGRRRERSPPCRARTAARSGKAPSRPMASMRIPVEVSNDEHGQQRQRKQDDPDPALQHSGQSARTDRRLGGERHAGRP